MGWYSTVNTLGAVGVGGWLSLRPVLTETGSQRDVAGDF